MLKKILPRGKLLKTLIKKGIVHSIYSRSSIKEYHDIAPSFHSEKLERLGISSNLHIGGKGLTKKNAMNSCAGEVIERISLMRNFSNPRFIKKYNLKTYFHKKELNKFKLNSQMSLQSIRVINYITHKKVLFPELFFIPNSENRILPKFSNSIGGSFAKNKDDAILGSILEVIERHSLLKAWYTEAKLKKINLLDKKLKKVVEKFSNPKNIEIDFYEIPSEFSCSVSCCKISYGKGSVFGCCADLCPKVAIKKSLTEALQLYLSSKFIFKNNKKTILEKRFKNLIKKPQLNFSENLVNLQKKTSKRKLLNSFIEKNMNIFYLDVTHPIFKKIGYVIKVFCPELLQFPTTNSLIYKTNYKYIKNNKKAINPFV